MNKIIIPLFMTCLSVAAYAGGSAESTISKSTAAESTTSASTAEADIAAGEGLMGSCVACHGETGNSPASVFPNIAGQTKEYLLKQMLEIQHEERQAQVMQGMLDDFSETDLKHLAAYYASQQPASGAADAERVALGESIYRFGISRKSIAACTACHSPTGSGNGPAGFPALAGQWPDYTVAQLKAFRSGARHNDGEAKMMQTTTEDMNDREIEAVAAYIYGLRK